MAPSNVRSSHPPTKRTATAAAVFFAPLQFFLLRLPIRVLPLAILCHMPPYLVLKNIFDLVCKFKKLL